MDQDREHPASADRIVAIGLLTRNDLALLGPAFDRAWPIDDTPSFEELLKAIDEADRELSRDGQLIARQSEPDEMDG